MATYVDCTITITKGDPKRVLTVVRTKESVIDLSRVATGKHHLDPEFAKEYAEIDAEYSTSEGHTIIKFWAKNWTPDAILCELAEFFPNHEFTVVRGFQEDGEETLEIKNGNCTLIKSQWWDVTEQGGLIKLPPGELPSRFKEYSNEMERK